MRPPSASEWIDCKRKDGTQLPIYRCNQYRSALGLGPHPDTDSLNATAPSPDRKELTTRPKNSENNPPLVLVGPGTEFAGIMTVLGIVMPDGCDCKKTMFKMNEYGVQGCKDHYDKIVNKIKDNLKSWGWDDKLKNWKAGGWNYVKHPELWRWVNPINPIPGLLRLAIHLAEKKGTAS